jgi:hypothetical protein
MGKQVYKDMHNLGIFSTCGRLSLQSSFLNDGYAAYNNSYNAVNKVKILVRLHFKCLACISYNEGICILNGTNSLLCIAYLNLRLKHLLAIKPTSKETIIIIIIIIIVVVLGVQLMLLAALVFV